MCRSSTARNPFMGMQNLQPAIERIEFVNAMVVWPGKNKCSSYESTP